MPEGTFLKWSDWQSVIQKFQLVLILSKYLPCIFYPTESALSLTFNRSKSREHVHHCTQNSLSPKCGEYILESSRSFGGLSTSPQVVIYQAIWKLNSLLWKSGQKSKKPYKPWMSVQTVLFITSWWLWTKRSFCSFQVS